MSIREFAESEMRLAGLFDKDSDYDGELAKSVMRLIDVFSEEGHSGFSANMAISIFQKVARFEPITPLTGEDDEWNVVGGVDGNPYYQNKRCSHVFKDADGSAYDIQGKVFREPSGACFTGKDSRVPVTFPYVPKTEYVDVPASDQ